MEKEIKDRKAVQECYSKVSIKQFGDITTRYDAHTCSTCNNYTFLSYLSCGRCKRKGCIQHISVCDCLNAIVSLNVRFSEAVKFFLFNFVIIFSNRTLKSLQKKLKEFSSFVKCKL